MPLPTGMPPSSSLGRPFDLLTECHRRIERCLHVLGVFAARPAGAELGGHDRDLLALALRYLRESVPLHTADEEESLFPRMRHATHPLAIAAMHRLAALESDHAAARPRRELADLLGQRWLEWGHLGADDQQLFRRMVAALAEMYAAHIALEDREVFPLAARILSRHDLNHVGVEMARRWARNPASPAGQPRFAFSHPVRSPVRPHALQTA